MSASVQIPINSTDNWGYVFSAVLTGLIVVFFILAILIMLIWLMGKLMGINKAKKDTPTPKIVKSPPVSVPAPQAIAQSSAIDNEIAAAIAAAIHAIGESEGKQYKILQVNERQRPQRGAWGNAGVNESMVRF